MNIEHFSKMRELEEEEICRIHGGIKPLESPQGIVNILPIAPIKPKKPEVDT